MKSNDKVWRVLSAVALLLIALALSACSMGGGAEATVDDAGSDIPVITVTLGDDGLGVPAETPSGVVAIDPSAAPDAFIARLNDGVTTEQLTEALASAQEDPTAALALLSLLGGASNTTDGHLIVDLKPGTHAVVIRGEAGAQVATFTAGEASGATAPTPDVVVDLVDFNFAIPTEISAGPKVWQINNKGQQWHEMAIVKLSEGATVDDVLAMLASGEETDGPPPFEDAAFWAPNSPGETGYVTWDLPAGEYTVLCFLPDLTGDFSPHAAHGMVAQLTVTE